MSEKWNPVAGWESLYSVSDRGRVRREAGAVRRDGRGTRTDRAGKIVKGETTVYGYRRVYLCDTPQGRKEHATIHSLVLAAFVGPRPDGAVINHVNGRRIDNRLCNLAYCTQQQNVAHAIDFLGHDHSGENHHAAILTEKHVRAIHAEVAAGGITPEIAVRYGVARATIYAIVGGHNWQHLGLPKIRTKRPGKKLNREDIPKIRAAIAAGEPQLNIARRYGVNPSSISDIHTGKKWRSVP